MKRQINEIVRMRRLAGLITEAEEQQELEAAGSKLPKIAKIEKSSKPGIFHRDGILYSITLDNGDKVEATDRTLYSIFGDDPSNPQVFVGQEWDQAPYNGDKQNLKEGPAVQLVLKAVQAALAKGSTVEVNGEEVISVVPLAGRFKTSDGGMIKIGDVESIKINGKPVDLEMPHIDQSSPNFKYTPTDPGDSITGYHGD